MTKARVFGGVLILIAITGWAALRPGPRSAAAAGATDTSVELVEYDPFTEENAAHRYATSQTRHWRHVLTRRP